MTKARRHPGSRRDKAAFILIELLVVIAIIALLTSILLPSLTAAKDLARQTQCLANLHSLGVAMNLYLTDNGEYFWPYLLSNWPTPGDKTYFWGKVSDPLDTKPSPFMAACDFRAELLGCPALPWGSYVPQAGMNEPTTCFGYNAWCLDPRAASRRGSDGKFLPRKKSSELTAPHELFVFNDSAMFWAPAGVPILQNSTFLEPISGMWIPTPTSHFRHLGKTDALCADGHAAAYGLEGGTMRLPAQNLSFVGTTNVPHYDQE